MYRVSGMPVTPLSYICCLPEQEWLRKTTLRIDSTTCTSILSRTENQRQRIDSHTLYYINTPFPSIGRMQPSPLQFFPPGFFLRRGCCMKPKRGGGETNVIQLRGTREPSEGFTAGAEGKTYKPIHP